MALVSTRTYTWAQLASSSVTWGDTNPFLEWTGNGTTISGASTDFGNLVHTTDAIDFGASRDFFCTATAISTGSHAIVIQTSPDDTTYTNKSVTDDLTGRYVKFQVTVTNGSASAELQSIETEIFFDPIEETFDNFSVGATATTLPIARNYSRILNMNFAIKHDVSGLQKFVVALTDVTKTAPKVISYDLDTWGKVATATTADITLKGFPLMSTSGGNIVVS